MNESKQELLRKQNNLSGLKTRFKMKLQNKIN